MFAINMSVPENNKLFKHAGKIFKIFSLNMEKRFLFQFNQIDAQKLDTNFWKEHFIISNEGKKDIVIEGKIVPIYHIVNSLKGMEKFRLIDFNQITIGNFMYVTHEKCLPFPCVEISYIHYNTPQYCISSAEV